MPVIPQVAEDLKTTGAYARYYSVNIRFQNEQLIVTVTNTVWLSRSPYSVQV
jgi:hypothetical protein